MDNQEILKTTTHEVAKEPIYYNQEGKDRLTKALLGSLPKPIVDITVTHASGTLFCAVARVHYE